MHKQGVVKRTRPATSLILLPALALSLAVGSAIGCDTEGSTSSDRLAVTDAASDELDTKHRHGRSVVAALVHAATDADAIDDDERLSLDAVTATVADMHEEHRAAKTALRDAMASGAQTCSFDVSEALSAIDGLAKEHGAVDEELLDSLHEMLTDDQRAEVVDAVLTSGRGRPDGKPPRDGRAGGEQTELEGDRPPPPPPGHGGPPSEMRRLVEGLSLSESQIAALEEARPEPAARPEKSEEHRGLLDAFETSEFAAADFDLSSRASERALEHADRWVSGVTTLCGILDDEQRVKLAAALEEAPRG